MMGQFLFPAEADASHKHYVALQMGMLIADHLAHDGGKFEDVYNALQRYMDEAKKQRMRRERQIERNNKKIELDRRVIQAEVENEKLGMTQPDRLSREEIQTILRWGAQSDRKKLETQCWLRIAGLIGEGLTVEQAREKIYQDLVDKGDLKGAEMMRRYQNIIHPLMTETKKSQGPSNDSSDLGAE